MCQDMQVLLTLLFRKYFLKNDSNLTQLTIMTLLAIIILKLWAYAASCQSNFLYLSIAVKWCEEEEDKRQENNMTSKATGTSNGHRDPCTKCSSKNPPEANGGPIANGVDSCQHTVRYFAPNLFVVYRIWVNRKYRKLLLV